MPNGALGGRGGTAGGVTGSTGVHGRQRLGQREKRVKSTCPVKQLVAASYQPWGRASHSSTDRGPEGEDVQQAGGAPANGTRPLTAAKAGTTRGQQQGPSTRRSRRTAGSCASKSDSGDVSRSCDGRVSRLGQGSQGDRTACRTRPLTEEWEEENHALGSTAAGTWKH